MKEYARDAIPRRFGPGNRCGDYLKFSNLIGITTLVGAQNRHGEEHHNVGWCPQPTWCSFYFEIPYATPCQF